MNLVRTFLVAACLSLASSAYAQISCPPGWIAYGATPETSSCGPAPGAQGQGGQQTAPPASWTPQWGAVAIDEGPTNVGIGTAKGKTSKADAVNSALADCRSKGGTGCKLNIAYGNQCVALVAGIQYARGQPAATIEEASAQGLAQCRAAGVQGCTVYYSACSLPKLQK